MTEFWVVIIAGGILLVVGAIVHGLGILDRLRWQASVDRLEQEKRRQFCCAMTPRGGAR